ncbi:MAG: helix-turn-helix domain-containing protein [Actinobacteria bacterium]|nr:helix-turn-helix domain-containing protein [Actinomycetota bacterium]
MPPAGVHPKRTVRRRRALLEALCKGHSRNAAAAAAGLSKTTLYAWLHDDPLLEPEMRKAEADAERMLVERITEAADNGVWQAAAWLLERKWPEDYGARTRVTGTLDATHAIVGPDGGPVLIQALPARERLAGRIAGVAARLGTGEPAPGPDGSGSG